MSSGASPSEGGSRGPAAGLRLAARAVAALLVLAAWSPRGAGEGTEGTVRIVPRGGAGACLARAVLVAERADGGRPLEVALAGRSVLPLPEGVTSGRVTVRAPGCWAPTVPVEGRGPIAVPVFRAAEVHLAPRVAGGGPAPRELEITVWSPPGTSEPRLDGARVTCPVSGGVVRCELPATACDLRIAAPGHAPVYRWEVDLAAPSSRDLGVVELRPGASISGSVIPSEGRGVPVVEVRAVPETAAPRVGPRGRRLERLELRAEPDQRGFFVIPGVPPGAWRVVASGEGWSTATSPRIDVRQRREYRLEEPLVVRPTVRLTVIVQPPADPEGRQWEVELRRVLPAPVGTTSEPLARRRADPAGEVVFESLDRVAAVVVVRDGDGTEMLRKEIQVEDGISPLVIDVEGIPIVGVVRRGEEHIASARVVMTNPEARGTRREFVADARGEFAGVLPVEGRWRVEVRRENEIWVRPREVIVEADPDGEPVEIEIELPDTRLSGIVTWSSGEPCAGCSVIAFRPGEVRQLWAGLTDEAGRFQITGVEPGTVAVRAENGALGSAPGASDPVVVEVEESEDAGPIVLVMRRLVAVHGTVVFRGRVVPGAAVAYRLPGMGLFRTELAGPGGRFALRVPEGTPFLDLAVSAPGLPAHVGRHPVPADGARLIVSIGEPAYLRLPTVPGVMVRHGGAEAPALVLLGRGPVPLGPGDGPGVVLEVEAGAYEVCLAGECTAGVIAPGETLEVPAPAPPGARKGASS